MTSFAILRAEYAATVMQDAPWGYWKMNEASGDPQDSSGNGRHFTLSSSGSASYQQATPGLWTHPAISINGDTQRWTRAGLANAPGTTRTMEAWQTRTGGGGGSGNYFFGEQVGTSGQSRQWMIERPNATTININGAGEGANGSDRQIGFSWTVASTAVHFVTVWYADNTCTLYADGVAQSNQSTTYRSANTGTLFVGRPPDTFWGTCFGRLSDLAIYTTALSADSILRHYKAGTDLRKGVSY